MSRGDRPRPSPIRILVGLLLCACAARPGSRADAGEPEPAVRAVVERFGERLKQVPRQAPDSTVRRALREAYAPLVTPELLEAWSADPSSAPGREVSSPWPERIEISGLWASDGRTSYRVEGEVVYLTSVELTGGGAAERRRVEIELIRSDDGAWRISAYRPVLR